MKASMSNSTLFILQQGNLGNLNKLKTKKLSNVNKKGLFHRSLLLESMNEANKLCIKQFKEIMSNNEKFIRIEDSEKDNLKSLEEKEKELRNDLEIMKQNELRRLNYEFLYHNYERRFNITQHQVLSAVIGEENTAVELFKQLREQKVTLFLISNI